MVDREDGMMASSTPQSESAEMGRATTMAKLTNLFDDMKLRDGLIGPDDVRSIEIEMLVDTGATFLSLPRNMRDRAGAA